MFVTIYEVYAGKLSVVDTLSFFLNSIDSKFLLPTGRTGLLFANNYMRALGLSGYGVVLFSVPF